MREVFFLRASQMKPQPSEDNMDILLYAQPYDISAEGFYFRGKDEYEKKAKEARNSYGDPVEEFEIQFIDGGLIDCKLAKAIDISQAKLGPIS